MAASYSGVISEIQRAPRPSKRSHSMPFLLILLSICFPHNFLPQVPLISPPLPRAGLLMTAVEGLTMPQLTTVTAPCPML